MICESPRHSAEEPGPLPSLDGNRRPQVSSTLSAPPVHAFRPLGGFDLGLVFCTGHRPGVRAPVERPGGLELRTLLLPGAKAGPGRGVDGRPHRAGRLGGPGVGSRSGRRSHLPLHQCPGRPSRPGGSHCHRCRSDLQPRHGVPRLWLGRGPHGEPSGRRPWLVRCQGIGLLPPRSAGETGRHGGCGGDLQRGHPDEPAGPPALPSAGAYPHSDGRPRRGHRHPTHGLAGGAPQHQRRGYGRPADP